MSRKAMGITFLYSSSSASSPASNSLSKTSSDISFSLLAIFVGSDVPSVKGVWRVRGCLLVMATDEVVN